MYSSRPGLMIGFTSCHNVFSMVSVIASQFMVVMNGHDWLGYGFYFWENNYERALDFATHPPGKKQIKTPAVLGAVIDLEFSLDLMDTECICLVRESYNNLRSSVNTLHWDLPENKKTTGSRDLLLRELDCAVIENLHIQRKLRRETAFDSVRGLFVEGDPIYNGADFHEKSHVQICIRNPNCIKGFFIPRKEINWAG